MRAVIADDSVLLREGITRLLAEDDIEVVAGVGEAGSLLNAVEAHQPDLAVIDVRMPPGHRDEGLRAAIEIRRRWPRVALLVLSQFVEERYATELLAGETRGIGYLLKDRVADVAEFDRPSAISASTSRSRPVSRPSGSDWRLRASSCRTTSGSSAVPPAATRRTASMNSATSATRSLRR